jgi:hypothetical protein
MVEEFHWDLVKIVFIENKNVILLKFEAFKLFFFSTIYLSLVKSQNVTISEKTDCTAFLIGKNKNIILSIPQKS